jgi:cytoskeletal protein RodZ
LLKYMRRSNKRSNFLIIIGIVGLIVAVIVGILIWRAIFD